MISIDKCRKLLGEKGKKLTNEEVEKIRDELYKFGNLAFECWAKDKRLDKTDNKT